MQLVKKTVKDRQVDEHFIDCKNISADCNVGETKIDNLSPFYEILRRSLVLSYLPPVE